MKILADYLTDHFHSVHVSEEHATDPVMLELSLIEFPVNKTDLPPHVLGMMFHRSNIQPDCIMIDGPNKKSITTFAFSFDPGVRKDVVAIAKHIQAVHGTKAPVAAMA